MPITVVEPLYKDARTNRLQTGPVPLEARKPGRHYCTDCKKDYSERKALARHQRERCGKTEKMYKCQVCGKKYLHLEGLREHVSQIHGGEKPHRCNICNEGFDRRYDVRIHKIRMHDDAE